MSAKCRPFCFSLNVLNPLHSPSDLFMKVSWWVSIGSADKTVVDQATSHHHNQCLPRSETNIYRDLTMTMILIDQWIGLTLFSTGKDNIWHPAPPTKLINFHIKELGSDSRSVNNSKNNSIQLQAVQIYIRLHIYSFVNYAPSVKSSALLTTVKICATTIKSRI